MSLSGDRLARAEARSTMARAQFKATASRLRARLSPRNLATEAVGELRQAGEIGAARARQHPIALAAIATLLSTLALHLRRRGKATDMPADRSQPKRAAARRARKSK